MKKQKMTKDIIPDDFTLSLAIVDAIPVLFFCASITVVGILFKSILFVIGAAMTLFAGAVKVIWKIIVVQKRKNIWWMFLQMRILMPIGMLLMLLSVIINHSRINMSTLFTDVTSMPSLVFFIVGLIGMILMTIFMFKLDSSDVKSNWIEQITNGIAQVSIFIGILFLN